jgi:hypothetical protein
MEIVAYKDQIIELVNTMTVEELRKVWEFAVTVKNHPPATPGTEAIRIARELNFDPQDLAEMERAIEEACESADDFPEVDLDNP